MQNGSPLITAMKSEIVQQMLQHISTQCNQPNQLPDLVVYWDVPMITGLAVFKALQSHCHFSISIHSLNHIITIGALFFPQGETQLAFLRTFIIG